MTKNQAFKFSVAPMMDWGDQPDFTLFFRVLTADASSMMCKMMCGGDNWGSCVIRGDRVAHPSK
jgi:tRNA-dihydrouridine synthase